MLRIGVVGDYRAGHETHPATGAAVEHAAADLGVGAAATWIPTEDVEGRAGDALAGCAGVWIAPGSPYRSMQGALDAVTHARTAGVPLLGTCAGFQHAVIELARSLAGMEGAAHAEYDPDAELLVVSPLACALAGTAMEIVVDQGSIASEAYGEARATEYHYCSFGLNPDHTGTLEAAGVVVTGRDASGEPRIVELRGHPFFVVTLFVPQMRSAPGRPHPLVRAFVAAAGAGATA